MVTEIKLTINTTCMNVKYSSNWEQYTINFKYTAVNIYLIDIEGMSETCLPSNAFGFDVSKLWIKKDAYILKGDYTTFVFALLLTSDKTNVKEQNKTRKT